MRASVLDLAHAEALKSPETFRLGAVLFHKRAIIATGHNRNANSCGLFSIHAEMDVLWKTRTTKNATIVIVRVLRDGVTLACSKPCRSCEYALKRARVSRVIYTTGITEKPFDTILM